MRSKRLAELAAVLRVFVGAVSAAAVSLAFAGLLTTVALLVVYRRSRPSASGLDPEAVHVSTLL